MITLGTEIAFQLVNSAEFFCMVYMVNSPEKIRKNKGCELDKGKPLERVGRKATGLSPEIPGYGCRVAWRAQYLLWSVDRTRLKGGTNEFTMVFVSNGYSDPRHPHSSHGLARPTRGC